MKYNEMNHITVKLCIRMVCFTVPYVKSVNFIFQYKIQLEFF